MVWCWRRVFGFSVGVYVSLVFGRGGYPLFIAYLGVALERDGNVILHEGGAYIGRRYVRRIQNKSSRRLERFGSAWL